MRKGWPLWPTVAPAPATWDNLKDQYIKKEVDKATDRLIKRMLEWVHNRTDAPFKNTDWKDNPPPPSKDWAPYDTLANDFAKAAKLHRKLYPVFKTFFIEPNPVPIKTALAHAGLIASDEVRSPLCEMTKANRDALLARLALLGF